MIIGVLKEAHPGETRVALIPEHAVRLVAAGAQLRVEAGIGRSLGIADAVYTEAGAETAERRRLIAESDLLLGIRPPAHAEVPELKPGAVLVSLLDPFNAQPLVAALRGRNVTALSLEMIPRTTRAQKMDVLSSQANLAGYVAVITAAERLPRIFPMMMTPAGTIAPARVFVIGVGVAGLQAIATAKRLGARVEAFDTRPVVAEQVKSLGARFVTIDLGDTGETRDGYAKALTEDQLARQQAAMAKVCAASEVVITTAQVFGRRAPLIVTAQMLAGMQPGAVVVDLAVESGGNVEGARPDEEVVVGGVHVIGLANPPGRVAVHASQVFSSNLFSLIDEFWDREGRGFRLDLEDEILKGCVVAHQGVIVNKKLAAHYEESAA
jgi:NAD(P) transhydrogenase subunit alpha